MNGMRSLLIGQRHTKLRFLTATTPLPFLLAAILMGLIHSASAQLTVQIVNDSGLSDSNIFIMVPGATGAQINPKGLFVDKNLGTNTSVPLTTLATNSWGTSTTVSTISGTTNTVYAFQATTISSGAIYIIYNHPFTFTQGVTPSPAPDGGNGGSGFRYDYAEFSFAPGADNDVDLTYVDKFGIPLQLEWFQGTNTAATNLVAGSYVYASTKTLASLFGASGFASAVFGLTNAGAANGNITPGWQYSGGPGSYTNFARIVSPEKISSTGASVAPYPDVANYLNFLTNHPFTLNGYSVQGGSVSATNSGVVYTTNFLYYYLGYQTSVVTNNSGGWTFTLTYNPSLVPTNYNLVAMGATTNGSTATNVNIPVQYTNTITFTAPNTNTAPNASVFIYGAPTGTYYSTNGTPVTNSAHASYNVEVWMIGDVLSAINFGFAGGIYGDNSDVWFSPNVAWTSYPYGWAQPAPYNNPTNGYYNPYAALMYYNADAYTFAFSERITPDVGMGVNNGDTIRITILPDDRLDSPIPVVQTNLTTTSSITLSWNPVAGATGYQVNVLRPLGIPPATTTATSHTLNGLLPGAPYVLSVQATGMANGHPVITPARPIVATTAGNNTTTNGDLITIAAALTGVSDSFSRLQTAAINGLNVSPNGATVAWTAWQGTNQVVVKLLDQNANIVFDDWATFVLSSPFTNNGVIYTAISDINFFGQEIGSLPTFAGNLSVIATNGVYWIPTNNVSSVISLNYAKPAEIRKHNPLASVVPATGPVLIQNVVSMPGGGIQFSFDVPAGTNYVVESSANLTSWQTNATGIGQIGGESYTNAAGSNVMQFYRIKL